MWRQVRIAILSLILVLVGLRALTDRWGATDWDDTLWIGVFPLNGDGRAATDRYLDTLTQTLMVRQLQPWHANIAKRQVKAPKVYVRDSGLLHTLLGITNQRDLEDHPNVGASWEGYAGEELLKALRPDEAYFWATHNGAELDLLLFKRGRRLGVASRARRPSNPCPQLPLPGGRDRPHHGRLRHPRVRVGALPSFPRVWFSDGKRRSPQAAAAHCRGPALPGRPPR